MNPFSISRRSVSSCDSPGPLVPMPPPSLSRWLHCPAKRGKRYWCCANSTWSFPSRVRARLAKMSNISATRSMTFTCRLLPGFLCCTGEAHHQIPTVSKCNSPFKMTISSSFPLPDIERLRRHVQPWIILPTISAPADFTSCAARSAMLRRRQFGRFPSWPTVTERLSPAVSEFDIIAFLNGFLLLLYM